MPAIFVRPPLDWLSLPVQNKQRYAKNEQRYAREQQLPLEAITLTLNRSKVGDQPPLLSHLMSSRVGTLSPMTRSTSSWAFRTTSGFCAIS